MAKVAIDIDDTLYSFGQLAREMFVEVALERGDKRLQRGAYCAWVEWRSPSDATSHDGEFWPYVIERCHAPEVIARQRPFPGAASVCETLAEQHEIMYISNRSGDALEATQEWLDDYGFPSAELVCTMDDKKSYMAGCQYLIDDRPKTLVEFVYDYDWKNRYGSSNERLARKAFGLFGEYNRSLTDVPNIWLAPSWKLLAYYLIEKGGYPWLSR